MGPFIKYLQQRSPSTWNISVADSRAVLIYDFSIDKGKGFNVSVHENISGYTVKIEFQDFARELFQYAEKQLGNKEHPIFRLIEADRNLTFKRYRRTVEELFQPETIDSDGWWIVMEYRQSSNSKINVERFADLFVSFMFFLFPYTVEAEEEGTSYDTILSRFERSLVNRSLCLSYHGYSCKACGINLGEQYGEVARKFIHVHHVNMISEAGKIIPDPIKDMIPLCPNCHGIAHQKNPPFTVDEIKNMIINNNGKLYA